MQEVRAVLLHCLKGKAGANPGRSRHCDRERLIETHCCQKRQWEGIRSVDLKSGDLPVAFDLYSTRI